MDIIRITEEPLYRKCCYFLPLRLCLQTWAFIKVLADILAISYLLLITAIIYSYEHGGFFRKLSLYHLLVLVVVALFVDLGFLTALIVGIFKKSFATLRVFYFYEFYAMIAETVAITIISVNLIQIEVSNGVICAVVGVFYILLSLCVNMTVKSEMIKLRNKAQYDFSRMPIHTSNVKGISQFKSEEDV